MSADPPNAETAVPERDDEPVPKLPRGRGFRFSGPEMFRIGMTIVTLIGVIVLARPCANSVSGFVTGMDGSGSAANMPKPGTVDQPQQYESLKPGMSDAEIKAAIERAKARNAEPGKTSSDSATP